MKIRTGANQRINEGEKIGVRCGGGNIQQVSVAGNHED